MPLATVGGPPGAGLRESWLLGRPGRRVQGHAYALSALGYVHRLAGDRRGAWRPPAASADAFARIDDAPAGARAQPPRLRGARRRLFDRRDRHLREALRLRERLGDRRGENLSLANLGLLSAAAGDSPRGAACAACALDRRRGRRRRPGRRRRAAQPRGRRAVRRAPGPRPGSSSSRRSTRSSPQGYLRLEAWTRLLAAELARDDGDPGGATATAAPRALFRRLTSRSACAVRTAR
jgi:hypothetical protein